MWWGAFGGDNPPPLTKDVPVVEEPVKERLKPYNYKSFRVCHYVELPAGEQFIAYMGSLMMRDTTKEGIEKKIDTFENSLDKLASSE